MQINQHTHSSGFWPGGGTPKHHGGKWIHNFFAVYNKFSSRYAMVSRPSRWPMVLYRHVNIALRVLYNRWNSTHTTHYMLEVLALNVKVTKKALKFLKKVSPA